MALVIAMVPVLVLVLAIYDSFLVEDHHSEISPVSREITKSLKDEGYTNKHEVNILNSDKLLQNIVDHVAKNKWNSKERFIDASGCDDLAKETYNTF